MPQDSAAVFELVDEGKTEELKSWLEAGGDPDICNQAGQPLIFFAAHKCRPDMLEALHTAGAKLNATDSLGIPASHAPLYINNMDIYQEKVCENDLRQILEFFRRNGTDYFEIEPDGSDFIFRIFKPFAIANTSFPINTTGGIWLIHNCPDINVIDEKGNTPLHLAVMGQHSEYLWHILARGGNYFLRNHDRKSPIDIAIESDKDLLIDHLKFAGAPGLCKEKRLSSEQRAMNKKSLFEETPPASEPLSKLPDREITIAMLPSVKDGPDQHPLIFQIRSVQTQKGRWQPEGKFIYNGKTMTMDYLSTESHQFNTGYRESLLERWTMLKSIKSAAAISMISQAAFKEFRFNSMLLRWEFGGDIASDITYVYNSSYYSLLSLEVFADLRNLSGRVVINDHFDSST